MGAAVSVSAVAVVEGRTEPVPGHFYALGAAQIMLDGMAAQKAG